MTVSASDTPNPNARKFTVNRKVSAKGSFTFSSAEEAAGHALGVALLAIPGVRSVFGVNDFVTVTRAEDASWDAIAPAVVAAMEAHL